MTIIKKVKFTKEDVEFIRNLKNICDAFDFEPWEVIHVVNSKCDLLHDITFEYEEEEN